MIDYIQWLLEGPEEEGGETLQWKSWSPVGRGRNTGLYLAERGEAGQAPLSPGAETARREALRGEIVRKRQGTQASTLVSLRGENFLSLGRGESPRGAMGEMGAEKAAPGESLYAAAMGASRLAGFAATQQLRDHEGRKEESPRPPQSYDVKSLDLAFQRDARRYDGGFSLF